MKRYKAILFDFDGTLLFQSTGDFLKYGMPIMAEYITPRLGITAESFFRHQGAGLVATLNNDGSVLNNDRFYAAAEDGDFPRAVAEPLYEEYYSSNAFAGVRNWSKDNPDAKTAVALARELADYVILATLPIFPTAAQVSRLSWVGLTTDDFDLVTDAYNSHFCKPNKAYYSEILEKFGCEPSECIMIGNDIGDDIEPANELGMGTFLVTDYIIDRGKDISIYRKGTFEELLGFLGAQ